MKNLALAAVLLAASSFAHSQTPPPPPQPRPKVIPPSHAEPASSLQKNIVIRLHGNVSETQEVDLSVTGAGPQFTLRQPTRDGSYIACEYRVEASGTGYSISYSIGSRVKIETSPNSSEYLDAQTTGTAILSPGKPLTLMKIGDRELRLTISEAVEDSE